MRREKVNRYRVNHQRNLAIKRVPTLTLPSEFSSGNAGMQSCPEFEDMT